VLKVRDEIPGDFAAQLSEAAHFIERLPSFLEEFSAFHRKTVANLSRFSSKECLMHLPKEIKLA